MKYIILITGVLLMAIDYPTKGGNLTASVSTIDITPPLEMKYTLGVYCEGYESSVSFYGPDLGEIISDGMIKVGLKLIKTQHD